MLEFAIVLVLIGCNAFFALSEMSVVTSRKGRLRQMSASRRPLTSALPSALTSALSVARADVS